MNAREHYELAERLLVSCQMDPGDEVNAPTYPAHEDGVNSIGNALAAAQVHATLALAAAHGANLTPLGVQMDVATIEVPRAGAE